ncbi:hypothetical protein [Glutamicibacter sp.]|jgi:hypothetical protein|uniref:hypothetical protein n=1 Tax=Glutamicibacter sp. TaxID=1931995 RepID=UPI002B480DF7|nr:hypothetical protein [Glutamicibacter sp.]HJX78740.1 hypothetical protein [Glutamicibacter sp.]
MQVQYPISEEIALIVPRLRDVSGHEAMARLFAFLRAVNVDCELDESGTAITYGPKPDGPDAEGPEGEFIQSLISIFDARLRAVPAVEERLAAKKLINTWKNSSQ